MRRIIYRLFWAGLYLSIFSIAACAQDKQSHCESRAVDGARYSICTFSPARDDMRLFLKDGEGQVYGSFDAVNAALAKDNKTLVFAMNAGMYHADRSAVGLYREAGATQAQLQTRAGPGNFGLVPNGVFHIHGGQAGVTETQTFLLKSTVPDYATQSGPMLVIDGKLHPKFLENSTSRKIRNGVGINGDKVIFVKSEDPVNFYTFATLFRDKLGASNALYLDGTISRLYSAELGRNDRGAVMGPIVGVVTDRSEAAK